MFDIKAYMNSFMWQNIFKLCKTIISEIQNTSKFKMVIHVLSKTTSNFSNQLIKGNKHYFVRQSFIFFFLRSKNFIFRQVMSLPGKIVRFFFFCLANVLYLDSLYFCLAKYASFLLQIYNFTMRYSTHI